MMRTPCQIVKRATFSALILLKVSAIVEAGADLQLTLMRFEWYPVTKYQPLDRIGVEIALKNAGNQTSEPYTVEFYASMDTVITAEDYKMGSHSDPGLPRYGSDHFWEIAVFPWDIPDGYYYLGVMIVCPNDVNPANNNACSSVYVSITGFVDLAAQGVEPVGSYHRPGEQITISTRVKNIGRRFSEEYDVEYFLRKSEDPDADACRLGSVARGGLRGLQEDLFTTTYRCPDALDEGYYCVRVVVTCPRDTKGENNERSSQTTWIGPFADLAVESVDIADGTYALGEQAAVRSLVRNVGDKVSDPWEIDYYVSTEKDVMRHGREIGSVSCPGLAPGEERSLETMYSFPTYLPQGDCYVGAILTCPNDGSTENNEAVDSKPVKLVYPPLYVSGRVEYRDVDSRPQPVRYALVRICDVGDAVDPLDDRVITETSTGADGGYGLLLPGDEQGTQQIYVKAYTQAVAGAYPASTSSICIVKDEQHESPYSVKSGLYPYPRTAPLTVNLAAPYTVAGFMVYDSIVEGFHKAKTYLGIEPNEIAVYTPSSDKSTYFDPNSGIHVAQGDRGDRDVIMHEYAHYVAQICNFAQGDVGDDPQHYWNLDLRFDPSSRTPERARNLAFREAWATLFSIATQYGDTDYPYSGDTQYQDYDEVAKRRFEIDLETQTKLHSTPGEYFENMNCCALWDIFDDNCDAADNQDTLSDPCLARIWTVLRSDRPVDIKGFWDRWFTRFTCGAEMLRIFHDHGMEFPYLGPSTAVDGFETGDFSGFAWVRFIDQTWVITSDIVHQGKYSARAAHVNDSQKSTLQIMMTVDDGPIKYWCKVSSELGMDKLQFFVDGFKKSELSGEVDWRQMSCSVKAGSHTFTWTYVKNGAGSEGADTVWLDDIEFPIW